MHNNNIDLTIIGGAGHVGLPLALCFANRGLNVLIHDINQDALDLIKSGKLPYIEYEAESLLQTMLEKQRLFFSSSLHDLPNQGPIIITIGTPVDEFLNPVHNNSRLRITRAYPYASNNRGHRSTI